MASKREQELEEIVREFMPAARDILWCALVWNDHNFDYADLLAKAEHASMALGCGPRGTLGDGIPKVNEWLAKVDRVLGSPSPQPAEPK